MQQPPPRSRRFAGLRRGWPVLLGGAWLALLVAPVLAPGRVLANRDILLFHLPLSACFRTLAAAGHLPQWNPWLNGGQPILSNPNYAAFYPPTWLLLPLPPIDALNLSLALHLAIAFAGAWRLARRLGAGRGAAAFAAVAYSGSGALLSLASAFSLLRGMSWVPWVLSFGAATLDAPADPAAPAGTAAGRRGWLRPAALCGLALAMVLLNGEPSMMTICCIALAALAAAELRRRPAAACRALVPLLLALALATVQLLPTAVRLAGTSRALGLPAVEAVHWSLPPARLVELALPHFFGDPSRNMEGLFFGRGIHDAEYPYVPSLYPGLLVSLLALPALALWPIPRRLSWILCVAGGAFLALGRHNPLYLPARRLLPPLGVQRFPERFIVLALLALVFAAALGWQRLLDERRAGRPQAADLPLALAAVVTAVAALLTALLYGAPALPLVFLREHGQAGATAATLARGLLFLRHEGWWAIATAAAATALFALCRWRRPRPAALCALAVLLLAADLWHSGRTLLLTVPASQYRATAPAILRQLRGGSARIFVEELPEEQQLPLAPSPAGYDAALARELLERAAPYSAALWQVGYALNNDFDRMLTHWGSVALGVLHADLRQQPEMAFRLLGAWNVGGMLLRASTAAGVPEDAVAIGPANTAAAAPRQILQNPFRLPLYRFVPQVSFYPDHGSALYFARREGFAVNRHEHCVRAGAPAGDMHIYPAAPLLLDFHAQAARLDLRYRSACGGFFVTATTFDEGWRATVDGAPLAVYPTAAGQLGVELPPGEHRLALSYRDRWVPAGAAVSLIALTACAVLLARPRRAAAG